MGQRKMRLLCRNDHYEETSRPFQMLIPSAEAPDLMGVRLCRTCWIQFVSDVAGMKELTDAEADKFLASAGVI